jgi:Divergent InlB B-repeat domain
VPAGEEAQAGRPVRGAAGASLAVALCLALLALAPTADAAALEQVDHFAGSATPLSKEQLEADEEIQLGGVSGMAVNYTGKGGVAKGTLYAATSREGEAFVAMYEPRAGGGLRFVERWQVAQLAGGEYQRCGPLLGTACAPNLAAPTNRGFDVDVDQATGDVFAKTGAPQIVEYKPDGSEEITRFGEKAPGFHEPGEKVSESPEKIHSSGNPGALAVNAQGWVYLFDRGNAAEKLYSRLMVFEPQSPGDYSHYVYAGEVAGAFDGEGKAVNMPVVDAAGDVYAAELEGALIQEYAPESPGAYPHPSTPACSFTFAKGGIDAIAVNQLTSEPFFYSEKKETKVKWVRQLGPCEAGTFKEVAKAQVSPERGDFNGALAFDPADRYQPSRPKGVLYGAAGENETNLGVVNEPGQSSLGYIFAPPKGPAKTLTVARGGSAQGTVTSEPIGVDCGSECAVEFEAGETVTLTATAAEGSAFAGWSGECASVTGSECEVTMSAARSVEASFEEEGGGPPQRTLAVSVSGEGEVECKFGGGSAGACTSPEPDGAAVEVIATADFGSQFKEWSATSGSAAPCQGSTAIACSFTLTADSSLTAVFVPAAKPKFKLTVTKSGTGSGTVTSTPAAINCGSGANCEAEYEEGVEVELKETPASGSEFKEWTGACTGSGACKVTISAAKAVGAVFNLIPRTLTIAKAGTGTGEVKCKANGGSAEPCAASYPNGTALKLEATANAGSSFAGYSAGTGSAASCTTSPCSFTIEANSSVTATFNLAAKPKFKLTVSKIGTGAGTVTSTPAAINCGSGANCEAEYEEGAEVTLNQAAATGSEFKEWTGACSGSGACKVTMSAAKAVGAVFNLIPRTLTIAKAGTGTGEVKCKVGAGSAEPCAASYPNGTALKLEATANPGSTFAGYSLGAGSASACTTSPCSFTIEANSSVTATFNLAAKPKFKLSVAKTGSGSGTVTSSPSGINCGSGANCEAEYEEGAEVTLNQAAAAGSEFKEWTGACTGSGTCKVTMSAAKAVSAKFEPIPRTLSIAKAGTGTGEVKCKLNGGSAGACTSPQPNGTAVEVLATANTGSSFAAYSAGTGSAASCTASPCSFTLEANSSLTATFNLTAKPKFKLTVAKSGTGSGTVTSTPSGINCGTGAGCEAEFEEGVEVTLNQAAASGSEFKEWTGACTGSGACKVTMSAAKSVGAVFNLIPRTLTIAKAGTGTGEVKCKVGAGSAGACTSPQPNGTAVEIIATANAGSAFAGFSAGSGSAASCSTSPCSFTLEANSSLTATFNLTAKPKFKLTVSKSGTGSGTVTSTPSGINCGSGANCEAEFEEGAEVELKESPAAGSEFKEWTGACTGSGACKVTMSAAKSVSAKFEPIPRTLTITKAGTGTGEVKCKFNGGTAGACTSPQPNGTSVELIATANAGSSFAGFSAGSGSAASCSTSPCSFTIEANSALTATFNPTAKPKFKLTVSKSGTGAGTVTSTPSGINCGSGAGCEAEFEESTEVELHESPATGSEFKEWSGACSGTGACKVTMSAAKAAGAVFNPIPRTLTIAKAGTGTGEVKCKANGGSAEPCAASYPNGTALKLEATANAGSSFAGFSAGTGSASSCSASPCSFTIEANSALTATFNLAAKPKFKLTVSKTGTGSGTVTSTPSGINCGSGAGCEAEFEEGAEVELKETPASGSEFKEWTGACTGSGACKVTMSAARAVGAVFNLKPKPKFKLSVAKAGTGSGTVTSTPSGINCGSVCEAEYEEGTEVELKQSAAPGSEFKEWSGACSGSGTCKVTMSAAKNVGARFNPAPKPKFKLTVSKAGGGAGTIASSPAGISCGSTCEHEYEEGAHVTLTESPGSGSEFGGWQTLQCDESTQSTCEVTIGSHDEAVAASFVPQAKPKPEYTLTIEIQGNGSGLVTCNDTACAASYPEGSKVSFAAVALAGSTFSGWSGGGCSGTGACKVTIKEDTTVAAKFSSKPIVTPPPPTEKGVATASGIAQVQNESALIRLLCPGSSRCTGTLELFARLQDPSHDRRHFRRASSQATLIGTASFDLAPNSQGSVAVKITSQRALRLLGRGEDLDAQLLGTSVRSRGVRLVAPEPRHRRSGGR